MVAVIFLPKKMLYIIRRNSFLTFCHGFCHKNTMYCKINMYGIFETGSNPVTPIIHKHKKKACFPYFTRVAGLFLFLLCQNKITKNIAILTWQFATWQNGLFDRIFLPQNQFLIDAIRASAISIFLFLSFFSLE